MIAEKMLDFAGRVEHTFGDEQPSQIPNGYLPGVGCVRLLYCNEWLTDYCGPGNAVGRSHCQNNFGNAVPRRYCWTRPLHAWTIPEQTASKILKKISQEMAKSCQK